jgi:hypothetical protein
VPTTNRSSQHGRTAPPRRWPVVLAWALVAVELLLLATPPWFDLLNRRAGRPDLAILAPFTIPPTVAALMAGVVGAVLASRRPRHPVGWLLLAMGVTMSISGATVAYIPYGLVVRPGSLPPPMWSPGSSRSRSPWCWPRSGSSCC